MAEAQAKTQETSSKPKQQKQPEVIRRPKKFQRVTKGNREFNHDLFKLGVANFKKNISLTPGDPQLIDVEHCHFFHSFDSRGREQIKCTPQAGHWHQIIVHRDEDGEIMMDENGRPMIECGPPIKHNYKRIKGAVRKVAGPVRFRGQDEFGNEGYSVDDHTHEIIYIESEKLTSNRVKSVMTETASSIELSNLKHGFSEQHTKQSAGLRDSDINA